MPDLLTCLLLAWAVLATAVAVVQRRSARQHARTVCALASDKNEMFHEVARLHSERDAACAIAREAHDRLEACRAAGRAVGERVSERTRSLEEAHWGDVARLVKATGSTAVEVWAAVDLLLDDLEAMRKKLEASENQGVGGV